MLTVNRDYRSALLEALGIPHLEVRSDDQQAIWLTQADATKTLEAYVARQEISADEAGEIRAVVDELSLFPSFDQLREAIWTEELDDRLWEWDFKPCQSCDLPFVHGYMENRGRRGGALKKTFLEVMSSVMIGVESGNIDIPEGIHLLKQAVEINLPYDGAEFEARFEALPAEARAILDSPPVDILEQMFGVGEMSVSIMVLEIDEAGDLQIHEGLTFRAGESQGRTRRFDRLRRLLRL